MKEVWVVFPKKHTGEQCMSYEESVEEALCYGWIDSIIKRIDDANYATEVHAAYGQPELVGVEQETRREMYSRGPYDGDRPRKNPLLRCGAAAAAGTTESGDDSSIHAGGSADESASLEELQRAGPFSSTPLHFVDYHSQARRNSREAFEGSDETTLPKQEARPEMSAEYHSISHPVPPQ